MVSDVALIEQSGEMGAPDPEEAVSTVASGRSSSTELPSQSSISLDAGGRRSEPVVAIATSSGSIELGFDDIFLIMLFLQTALTGARLFLEVKN